jgi:Xaa-Pro aminopeptidase
MAKARSSRRNRQSASRPTPAAFEGRLRLLRDRLPALKLDGFLLTHAADIAHLTGFSGHDSVALVTPRDVTVFTDSRYTEELQRDASHVKLALRTKSMSQTVAPVVERARLSRVGFEANFATFGLMDGIRRALRTSKKSKTALVPISDLMQRLRAVKSTAELVHTRHAVAIAQAAFDEVMRKVKPGVTEGWIAGALIFEMRAAGATDAAFDPIVGAGPNSSLPHYTPGPVKLLTDSLLLVDWGALVDGYRSDLTRTMFLGKVHPKLEKIYKIVLEANEATIAKLRPGMTGKEADAIARNIIKKAGYGDYFGHGLGHGVGRDIHEEPRLHKSRDKDQLQPGHVITVEPGIYLPGLGGVRIEDDILITQDGCEVLTSIGKSFDWARNVLRG